MSANEEKEFPSLDLIYDLAVASYEVAQKLLDAMNLRLQKLLALLLPLVLAFPVALKALNLHMGANFLWATEGSLLLSITLCLIGCAHGHIQRIDPSVLFEHYLSSSCSEFKRDTIKNAGEAMVQNVKTINRKWLFYLFAIISFGLSVVFLILWASGMLEYRCAGLV